MKNVNKISIVGGPGTGKSTLAKKLGKKLNKWYEKGFGEKIEIYENWHKFFNLFLSTKRKRELWNFRSLSFFFYGSNL